MTFAMRLSAGARRAITAHARAEKPLEACGVLIGRVGADGIDAVTAIRARNAAASPTRFELDPRDLLEADARALRSGCVIVAIYHSHPEGGAHPSQADLTACDPAWPMVIVGTGDEIRAWRVDASRTLAVEQAVA